MRLNYAFCIPLVCAEASAHVTLSYLNNSEKWCFVRNGGFTKQRVEAVPCSEVYGHSLASATWIRYPDGRIRGTNGLCLQFLPDTAELVAQKCWHNDAEKWKLGTGRLSCPALEEYREHVDSRVPSASAWLLESIVIEPLNADDLLSLHGRKLERDLVQRREAFRQLPNPEKDMADIAVTVSELQSEEQMVEDSLLEIKNLYEEIKADMIGTPHQIGQGMVCHLGESADTRDVISFITPSFYVTPEQIRLYSGLSSPATVTVSGYVICKKDGLYTFVIKDVTSSFKLTVDGQTVVDQWGPPTNGDLRTQTPLNFSENQEILLTATASGLMATPSFHVQWTHETDKEPQDIPTDILYPNFVEPICTDNASVYKGDCFTTFNDLAALSIKRMSVACPTNCLGNKAAGEIYGTPQCYAPQSSICMSAIHSGVLGERGGTIAIEFNRTSDKARYTGVAGFLISSSDGPAGKGCGIVTMPLAIGAPLGLKDLQITDTASLLSGSSGSDFSGYSAVLTNATGQCILAKRESGDGYLSTVGLSCAAKAATGTLGQRGLVGSATVLWSYATSSEQPQVSLIYIQKGNGGTTMRSGDDFNRLTCQTSEGERLSLYFSYAEPNQELNYASGSLTCDTTFAQVRSPLHNFNVRCPKHCAANSGEVIGSFSYGENSSVCRSAYHAGVIAEAGGVVSVRRLPQFSAVTWSSQRNGIASSVSNETSALFLVERPTGRQCIYPQHPPGIINHISGALPRFSGVESFLQLSATPQSENVKLNSDREMKVQPHADWELNFLEVESSPDLSVFMEGRYAGLNMLETKMQSSADNSTAHSEALSAARMAARSLEASLSLKLKEYEAEIQVLEAEAEEAAKRCEEPYTTFGEQTNFFVDWVALDAADAIDGPSTWAFDAPKLAILQTSAIASAETYAGAAAILRRKQYDTGFIAAEVYIPEAGTGSFGFLLKHHSDKDFVAAVVQRDVEHDAGSISFVRCREGFCSRGLGQVSTDIPTGWTKFAVDFSGNSARLFLSNGSINTGTVFSPPIAIGGAVGVFTNDWRRSGDAVMFSKIVAGPLQEAPHLARDYFPPNEEEDLEVKTVKTKFDITENPMVEKQSLTEASPLFDEKPTFTAGPDRCIRSLSDSFAKGADAQLWQRTQGTWKASSGADGSSCVVAVGDPSARLSLVSPICLEGRGMKLTVDIAPTAETSAGLTLRATKSGYVAALIEFSSSKGPEVRLQMNKKGQETSFTTGTMAKLLPDVWHQLSIEDFGTAIKVLVDGHSAIQVTTVPEGASAQQGLLVQSGEAQFRNFRFEIMQ